MAAGGTAPAVLNAANEVAVSAFLQGRIGFLSIPALVEDALAALPATPADSLDALLAADAQARRLTEPQPRRPPLPMSAVSDERPPGLPLVDDRGLGVLVTFHEFGHYWVARRCGVKVLRFSMGFGKPLWSRRDRDGTEFALAAIPLGGYVKMLDEAEAEVPPVAARPGL